jgi:serine/threonine protein phosphatase PrpC
MATRKFDAFVFADIGARDHYEDRGFAGEITSQSGQNFFVYIVCDGVGGVNKGETAAQRAIDDVVRALEHNSNEHIPTLLTEAVKEANLGVLHHADGGKCTIAVALIHDDGSPYGRLYIASVGDSRIAIIRNIDENRKKISEPQIRWLNRVHNVAEDKFWHEGLPLDVGYQAANAHSLTRVMGLHGNLEPDLGFYHQAPNVDVANSRGWKGLELREGDTIMVCSDGMLENSQSDGLPVVRDEEFLRHSLDTSAEAAAKTLVSFAKGRKTQDNATLIVNLVAPDSKVRKGTTGKIPVTLWAAMGAIGLIAVMAIIFFINASQEAQRASADLEQERENRTAMQVTLTADMKITQTFAADATQTALHIPTETDTPSTPVPTPISANNIGTITGKDYKDAPININESVIASNLSQLTIWGPSGTYNGHAYLQAQTSLQVESADTNQAIMRLLAQQGTALVSSGFYTNGVFLRFQNSTVEAKAENQDSCLLFEYIVEDQVPVKLTLACLNGNCSYNTTVGGSYTHLPMNYYVEIRFDEEPITSNELRRGNDLPVPFLPIQEQMPPQGQTDYDACRLGEFVPPTSAPITAVPTSEATFTPSATWTVTPQPQSRSISGGDNGSQPVVPVSQPSLTPTTQQPVLPSPMPSPTPTSQGGGDNGGGDNDGGDNDGGGNDGGGNDGGGNDGGGNDGGNNGGDNNGGDTGGGNDGGSDNNNGGGNPPADPSPPDPPAPPAAPEDDNNPVDSENP